MLTKQLSYEFVRISGFDHISPVSWNKLVISSPTNGIFQTWEYQKAWWQVFGRGELILIGVYRNNNLIAIAPFFTVEGMIYLVGSGGSDYLDIIGEIGNNSFDQLLLFTSNLIPGFKGFVFYHSPEYSHFTSLLQKSKWIVANENKQVAPFIDIASNPGKLSESIRKKSLVRSEKWFKKNSNIIVHHLRNENNILSHLENFFQQHIDRWSITQYPSLFCNPNQKLFYKILTENMAATGWLRFTAIEWNQIFIAYHFGFMFKGTFLWYKPSFDISFARHSPGEVLLKQLFELALDEKAVYFDFGLGDELFKSRFSTNVTSVFDWGVYPVNLSL
jgi:hypothetical protein